MLSYFYGQQADQFTFYRIPKVLFTGSRFRNLSPEAKTLYGILLDRMNLSARNNWLDEEGRVYIIYTIEEIMADLSCGNKKAVSLLTELTKIGLIERRRQGLGKPNIIYVGNFITPDGHFQKCENDTSGRVEMTFQEVSKAHGNNTNSNNTEYRMRWHEKGRHPKRCRPEWQHSICAWQHRHHARQPATVNAFYAVRIYQNPIESFTMSDFSVPISFSNSFSAT